MVTKVYFVHQNRRLIVWRKSFMLNKKKLIEPYEGEKPFIFISYSHKNKNEVISIMQRLQNDGYRLWYDEGIHPGSEWADYIAQFVSKCSIFLAFISDEYLLSSNCKDELDFARNKEKSRVLIYLKDVELPEGMSLRFNRLQNIHKNDYEDEDDFYQKLYKTSGILECKKDLADNIKVENKTDDVSNSLNGDRKIYCL